MEPFTSSETKQLLNAVGENILICDDQLNIIFINHYAEQLIQSLSSFTGLSKKEDYIGVTYQRFINLVESANEKFSTLALSLIAVKFYYSINIRPI